MCSVCMWVSSLSSKAVASWPIPGGILFLDPSLSPYLILYTVVCVSCLRLGWVGGGREGGREGNIASVLPLSGRDLTFGSW